MKKEIIQIENINVEDLKVEIIDGIIKAFKDIIVQINHDEKDQLLTREETAKMLSVSLVTLWTWDKNDILQSYRIGNKVRYKKSDILKALNPKKKINSHPQQPLL
nr:helix-turn-helix domain-containing protein [uncultured Flavobacterium sp.]